MTVAQKLKNTLFWGFILWFTGYVAGFILFFIVPKVFIGWVIMPLATLFTVWVITTKVKRPSYTCYFGLGLVWTIMAVTLDYLCIIHLLKTGMSYYQPDVLLYYVLTFSLPLVVGYWKLKHKPANTELF